MGSRDLSKGDGKKRRRNKNEERMKNPKRKQNKKKYERQVKERLDKAWHSTWSCTDCTQSENEVASFSVGNNSMGSVSWSSLHDNIRSHCLPSSFLPTTLLALALPLPPPSLLSYFRSNSRKNKKKQVDRISSELGMVPTMKKWSKLGCARSPLGQ